MHNHLKRLGMMLLGMMLLFSHAYAQNVEYLEQETVSESIEEIVQEEKTDSISDVNTEIKANENGYLDTETKHTLLIMDEANLLSVAQKDALQSDMMPLLRYGNMVFLSVNDNSTTADALARNAYHDRFGTSDGILLLIDMDNREIILFSEGNTQKSVTADKEDSITDNVFRYASRGDYYTCASTAFKQTGALLKGEKISEPMKYISNTLIALTVGFFISFLFVWKNSGIKSASSQEVLKYCQVAFSMGAITATKIGEHRVYSPPSSSGSSGFHSSGGGGGGFSSHSSGSSGGHRF